MVKTELAKVPKDYLEKVPAGVWKFYHGKGCMTCGNTGYRGRTVIGEMFEAGPEIKDVISKEQFDTKTVGDQLAKQKYITLMQDGLIKTILGQTTIEEVLRATQA